MQRIGWEEVPQEERVHSLDIYRLLYGLTEPERARQRQQMVAAMKRVVALSS